METFTHEPRVLCSIRPGDVVATSEPVGRRGRMTSLEGSDVEREVVDVLEGRHAGTGEYQVVLRFSDGYLEGSRGLLVYSRWL